MPVAEMRDRLSNAEYVEWFMYFADRAQSADLERRKAKWRT